MRGSARAGQRRRSQLVILTRWPAPGRCKRRLAAALGAPRAAAIQFRLTAHCVDVARQAVLSAQGPDLPGEGFEVVLAVSGMGHRAARRWGEALGADTRARDSR